ncbi:MAG TPA: NAD(P)-dependent oxidoreductase [Candidatus Ozemobacteraceae bacterium]|nr:NAD(P)-dependent oxidoreductase [Candidatus Ozemobacteraceae bacterium]
MSKKKEHVVVFGGSGFLGSHVADALSESGFHVRLFDCNSSPYRKPDQEMIVGDIMDPDAVARAASGCRYVYNFAALADMDDAKNKPLQTAKLNIIGNLHALEAARMAKAERFVFASSVYVYSAAGSFYRVSKQSAESFVEAYQERYGLPYTILRYGSLYGRRADKRNAIFNFLKTALTEGAISYKGSPDSMREYIHVADAARLSVQILDAGFENRHIILTGHERMPVRNLLKMISEMISKPGQESVKIHFSTEREYWHYEMTPYAFHPKIGHKLVANDYVDLGQGLLDCIAEIHEAECRNGQTSDGDWIVDKSDET